MITHLDGDKTIRMDRYTIHQAIAYRDKEIIEHYLGSVNLAVMWISSIVIFNFPT
jgi:hypothetical protein